MKNNICKRLVILNTENIKICGRITKLEAIKNAIFLPFLAWTAGYLQKFEFLIFQRSEATCLK